MNLYSLQIPITLTVMGLATLIFYYFKKIPRYLAIYAIGLILVSISISLHSLLNDQVLLQSLAFIFLLYFISCSLHITAIFSRLRIPVDPLRLFALCIFGMIGIQYYSSINNDQIMRLFITGVITFGIYLHRPYVLFKLKTKNLIDTYLKWLGIAVAFLALTRSIILALMLDNNILLSAQETIWGVTQLIILFVDVIFFALLIGCVVQDILVKLTQERNLDPLTGLMNRRALSEYLRDLKHNPSTQNALLIIDLDHFKAINDQYGHQMGDLALQHTSLILQHNIRDYDKVSRIGGEEFLVLLQDINTSQTLYIAERIRKALESSPLMVKDLKIHLTLSIGVSFFKQADQFELAITEADQLLYRAKHQGRNQVEFPLNHS